MNLEQAQIAALLSNYRGRFVADDQDVGILVKYIGTQASGTVTVAATTGDITFKHGALGAEAVDTTVVATTGIIDVSETYGDTMGEVVDLINASPNWKAVLVDCLRADPSTVAMLKTMAATQAKVTGGLKLLKSSAACLNLSLAIDRSIFKGIEFDNTNWINTILSIISKNTFTGTNLIQIYSINRANKTEKKVYERAGGATTVEQVLPASGMQMELDSFRDDILLVRMIGSAACTGYLCINGKQTNFNNPDY